MGETKREPSEGRLVACALLSLLFVALGALFLGSVVSHMIELDLLRRKGIAVHGWVTGKRADDSGRILTRHIVSYDFWPDHEFDKPYQRAKRVMDMGTHRRKMEADIRKKLERAFEADPEGRQSFEDMFRRWHEETKREDDFYNAFDRKPPRCPREDPYRIGGRYSGATSVSRAEYDSLSAKDPVPVTLVAGKRWLHTIGRVDSRRVWRVPLWRIEDVFRGLFLLVLAFLSGAGAFAELRRLRRAARNQEATEHP